MDLRGSVGLEWVEMSVSQDPAQVITGTVQVWDNSFGGGDWYSVQAASIKLGGRKVAGSSSS